MTMDADTLAELRLTLREVFAGASTAAEASRALAELGWEEAAGADPVATTVALFEEQGRALGRSRALDDLVLAELTGLLPAPTGPRVVALPYPAGGGEPGPQPGGIVLGGLDDVTDIVLPIRAGSGVGLIVLPPAALKAAPLTGLDPDAGWIEVTAAPDSVSIADMAATAPGAVGDAGPAWDAAVTAARRALAAELVGVGWAMLALAVTHVTDRHQFGRPIGSFQAVRHRLAEAHVGLTAAAELVGYAWRIGDARSAAAAKAVAGRAADDTARQALQVCGAMGLTWEHPLHRHARRAGVLDPLLGGAAYLERELGREAAANGVSMEAVL